MAKGKNKNKKGGKQENNDDPKTDLLDNQPDQSQGEVKEKTEDVQETVTTLNELSEVKGEHAPQEV